ncbi:MAG: hypothetical protein FXF54_13765 [Kosmotoga sp.]|nr:MAG: hypothetical protein FXF54_13765 [Kosmotoga sp.]
MIKLRIKLLFVLFLVFFLANNVFGEFNDMVIYEFRLLDLNQEKTEQLKLEELLIANEIDTPETITFFPLNGDAFALSGEGLSEYLDISGAGIEKSFVKDFNPVIITTLKSPSSVSTYNEDFGLYDGSYSVEYVIFYVIPEQYSEKGGFLSTINIVSSGNLKSEFSVTAKHKEGEWIPLAFVSLNNPQKSSSLSLGKKSNVVRHSLLFMRACRYSKETLTEDFNIYANLTGMESLLKNETPEMPVLHDSFFSTQIGFSNSGIDGIVFDYRQILFQSFYSELVFNMNPNDMGKSEIGLELGAFGEKDFAIKAFGNYNFDDASEKRLTIDFGLEDFTQPFSFLVLGANLYPLRIYPLETLEKLYEFPMIWGVESKFVLGKNYFITVGLEGTPIPNKVFLDLGYKIADFSIILGMFYGF